VRPRARIGRGADAVRHTALPGRPSPATRSQPALPTRGLLPSDEEATYPPGFSADEAWAYGPRAVAPTDDGAGETGDRSWEHLTVRHRRRCCCRRRRRRRRRTLRRRSFRDSYPQYNLEPTHTPAAPSLPSSATRQPLVETRRDDEAPKQASYLSSSLRFGRCGFLPLPPCWKRDRMRLRSPRTRRWTTTTTAKPGRAGPRVKGRCS
jgi:hypothetical protein